MKKSDTIGNQTRDLPACSAVPQPTAPPAACPQDFSSHFTEIAMNLQYMSCEPHLHYIMSGAIITAYAVYHAQRIQYVMLCHICLCGKI